MNAIHTEGSHAKTKPIEGPISFSPINPNRIIVPHYDTLVLTLCINGSDVHRVLMNHGNAADLLHLPAFRRILSGFNGATMSGSATVASDKPLSLGF